MTDTTRDLVIKGVLTRSTFWSGHHLCRITTEQQFEQALEEAYDAGRSSSLSANSDELASAYNEGMTKGADIQASLSVNMPDYPPVLPQENAAEKLAAEFYKQHSEYWIHPLASSSVVGDKDRATIRVHKAMAAYAASRSSKEATLGQHEITQSDAIDYWRKRYESCAKGLSVGRDPFGPRSGDAS